MKWVALERKETNQAEHNRITKTVILFVFIFFSSTTLHFIKHQINTHYKVNWHRIIGVTYLSKPSSKSWQLQQHANMWLRSSYISWYSQQHSGELSVIIKTSIIHITTAFLIDNPHIISVRVIGPGKGKH